MLNKTIDLLISNNPAMVGQLSNINGLDEKLVLSNFLMLMLEPFATSHYCIKAAYKLHNLTSKGNCPKTSEWEYVIKQTSKIAERCTTGEFRGLAKVEDIKYPTRAARSASRGIADSAVGYIIEAGSTWEIEATNMIKALKMASNTKEVTL